MIQSKARAEAFLQGLMAAKSNSFLKLNLPVLIISFLEPGVQQGPLLFSPPLQNAFCFCPPLQKSLAYFSISKLFGQRQKNRLLAGLGYFWPLFNLFDSSFTRLLVLVLVLVLMLVNDDSDDDDDDDDSAAPAARFNNMFSPELFFLYFRKTAMDFELFSSIPFSRSRTPLNFINCFTPSIK